MLGKSILREKNIYDNVGWNSLKLVLLTSLENENWNLWLIPVFNYIFMCGWSQIIHLGAIQTA